MPYLKPERPEKVSAPSLLLSKQRGERLVCLTAYDYPTARIDDEAVKNALRLVKEGGAEAIKLEGGHKRVHLVKRLVDEEISVMGHIGLTPQSINQLGAYRVQGKTAKAAQQLIDDAKAME